MPPSRGATADLWSLIGLAGVLEGFGGLMIVLGFLTRPVAFGLLMVWPICRGAAGRS